MLCSSLWLDALIEISSSYRRTVVLVSNRLKGAWIDGAANPAHEQWGKTTEDRCESGIGSCPGVCLDIKPPNAPLKLYGGSACERMIHECPPVSREKVANILLAHAGRGGGRGVTEASAEIARKATVMAVSLRQTCLCIRESL